LLKTIPHATLKVFPDTGHALHWEHPERFAEDLLRFIASTPA
jgi:pimeloyl-ACP methyl ester carboxylesterase